MDKLDLLVDKMHESASKKSQSQTLSTREMTSLDDLTHNFTESKSITRLFLEKHGQVFLRGRRYTR